MYLPLKHSLTQSSNVSEALYSVFFHLLLARFLTLDHKIQMLHIKLLLHGAEPLTEEMQNTATGKREVPECINIAHISILSIDTRTHLKASLQMVLGWRPDFHRHPWQTACFHPKTFTAYPMMGCVLLSYHFVYYTNI